MPPSLRKTFLNKKKEMTKITFFAKDVVLHNAVTPLTHSFEGQLFAICCKVL
jgi:hypothetical protein